MIKVLIAYTVSNKELRERNANLAAILDNLRRQNGK